MLLKTLRWKLLNRICDISFRAFLSYLFECFLIAIWKKQYAWRLCFTVFWLSNLIVLVMSACLSYKTAYQRQHHAENPHWWFSIWFTTADWWCCPRWEGEWKMCSDFLFIYFTAVGKRDKHVIIFLYVIQVLIHPTPTHTPSVKRTPTYVACVLMDEMRGGPRLPKCRQWTDCGEVMNGWSRLCRGAEETISAMLISPRLLHPTSIPHGPVLLLAFKICF